MSDLALTVDSRRFEAAFREFMARSRRDCTVVLREQAKGFVKRAIAYAPPSRGTADAKARARGEQSITSDLHAVFDAMDPREWKGFFDDNENLKIIPVTHEGNPNNRRGAGVTDYIHFLTRGEMKAFHQAQRTHEDGSVQRVNRDNLIGRKKSDVSRIGFVTTRDFESYRREAIRTVGKLASGWNAAAEELGYNPPAWIRRHGVGRGDIRVQFGQGLFRILIRNDVSYAGRVKDLDRSVQRALDEQARAMERRVEFAQEKAARAVGLK